ncbi:DsbA family protein [Salibacter halophilus]|uniref:DsbA family protein n=1 Tax=Salibacter halophilus TaxID=1803916 RepID=A0A6N6M521_9FLAO|nr:DsbA family protein [Salibacter halophilus]KAB1064485.1 DsbA family protein [Salibacter halophilus]
MDKLLYFFDPLCGWCYGFSKVIGQIHEKYADKLDFTVYSGGMITGDQVKPIGELADFLRGANEEVEKRSGVKFGEGFKKTIEEGTNKLSSLEPARAISTAKNMAPHIQIPFAERVQQRIYFDGAEPASLESYLPLAKEFDLDEKEFREKFYSNESITWAVEDFYMTKQFGIQGFPATIIEHNGEYFMVGRGYMPFEMVDENIHNVINDLPPGGE